MSSPSPPHIPMAAAATLSSTSTITIKAKLFHSATPVTECLSFSHQLLHNCDLAKLHRNPTIGIRHAKLNDFGVEEAKEFLGEALFDDGDDLIEGESDEDETESSVDLLIRFLQSMFKKVSRRAKKASRSVLPSAISPQLVSFAVDGILLLASLSIVKALLEVVCNLGGTVFVAILLLRVFWSGVSYFQSNGNDFTESGSSFSRTQSVS